MYYTESTQEGPTKEGFEVDVRRVLGKILLVGGLLLGLGAVALSSPPPDTVPPEIRVFTPQRGDVYILHQPVAASWVVSDPEPSSGLKAVIASAPDGEPIDTASVGRKEFRVFAVDEAGNASSVSVPYWVIYRSEILKPLSQTAFSGVGAKPPLRVRRGEEVPFAISIRDHFDRVVPKAVGTLTALEAATRTVVSVEEGIVGVFQFDPEAGVYRYTLKTEGLEPGQYEILVQFNDVLTIYRIALELSE